MSVEDISRFLLDSRMRYTTALMQQGRVLTDSDWNEMVGLEGEDRRQMIAETVCTAGSPNDGFKVGAVAAFPATIFPDPLPPPAPPPPPVQSFDFPIGGGSLYLGGYRFTIDPGAETFQHQSDWLTLTLGGASVPTRPAAGAARTDVVFLRGWNQSVSSTEDQEFREFALGGPDTTVRVRRMRRVEVLPGVAAANCAEARAALTASLIQPRPGDTGGPHSFDASGSELLSKARLSVSFSPAGPDADPCKPRQIAGFIGAENQAIRVQLTAANQFIWGIDNAAPLYRVQVDASDPTRRRLQFLTTPRDRASMPLQGQAIELLPWDALLANGEKAAAEGGFISAIASTYDPEDDTLTLTTAVPPNMSAWLNSLPASTDSIHDPGPRFFYLRVWTGGPPQAFVPGAPGPATTRSLAGTGLDLTFSDFGIPGDYWVIAARPNTPTLVVPWRLLEQAPPAGPRRFFTVLALINWSAAGVATVHDCRERFRSLCRNNGCCQVIVGDGVETHGDFTSIQAAIESLPPEGGEVCVLRGTYQPFSVQGKHDILIHGCGTETVIVAPGPAAAIVVDNSQRIVIRDLAIEAPATLGVSAINRSSGLTLRGLSIRARDRAAVLAKMDRDLVVEGCALFADPLAADIAPGTTFGLEPLLYAAGDELQIERNHITADTSGGSRRSAAGGIQIGGGSRKAEIRRNRIERGNGNGITLGSVRFVPAGDVDDPAIDGSTGGAVITVPGYTFDPNGCVLVPGDPADPTGPGAPPVPVSEGDLVDVRIIDNAIRRMGQNGIAVARLFFPAAHADLITIRRLLIAENTIERCMALEVGPIAAANIRRVAFGGIVLAEVELATIRDNVIEEVGARHRDAICGMFMLMAIGVAIEGNRARRNGRIATGGQPLKLGHRGGIIIRFARAPTEPLSFGPDFAASRPIARQDGTPAAIIHDNVVAAREGRALSIVALGPVSITDNQFTTHGSDFLALLSFLIAIALGSPLTTGGTTGSAAGLPPGVSTMDLLFDAMGGMAVFVYDLGWSNEMYLQMFGLSGEVGAGEIEVGDGKRWFVGGNVLFNDNQVVYDALNPVFSVGLCAVLLFSFDSVTMSDNQVDCDLALDFVIVNTLVAAWSTQVTGNRFKEGIFNAYLSAVTLGFVLNATGLNVGTHCILDRVLFGDNRPKLVADPPLPAPAPAIPYALHLNIALVDPDGENPNCREFERRLPGATATFPVVTNEAVIAHSFV